MTSDKAAQSILETILRPGQTVAGKYCVDHLIASGGMAAVWAGMNLRTGKRVALKVILRSFAATPGAEELFRREALAASRINHPNVVTVFDVVDHATKTCIVMEYLDGEDLGTHFGKKGRLAVEEAITLLLPAMRGVAAANGQGVIHRDLKPKNIFLCIGPDGRLVTTKILDFGISVIADQASESRSRTVQLTTHGTPAYMSPEHITGSPNIDQRTDVYGFGVILFEALAGQTPYAGPDGHPLLVRILEEAPPKLRRFRPDLSPELEEIVERAIAKNPEERYPSVNHFIMALEEHVVEHSPILRSLTPIAGIPLLEPQSGSRGLADPVVMVVRREPSGEHDDGVTKALHTLSQGGGRKYDRQPQLPGKRALSTEEAGLSTKQSVELQVRAPSSMTGGLGPSETRNLEQRAGDASTDGDTDSLPRLQRGKVRPWKLVAVPALVGLLSLALAWLVIPNPSQRPENHKLPRVTETVRKPAPPKVVEPAPEEAPATLGESPTDAPASEQMGPEAGTESTRTSARIMARGPARRQAKTPGRRGAQSSRWDAPATAIEPPAAAAQASTAAPPPNTPPPPEAPKPDNRAGRLSADDF
jgi:serine/threonine protein kinase